MMIFKRFYPLLLFIFCIVNRGPPTAAQDGELLPSISEIALSLRHWSDGQCLALLRVGLLGWDDVAAQSGYVRALELPHFRVQIVYPVERPNEKNWMLLEPGTSPTSLRFDELPISVESGEEMRKRGRLLSALVYRLIFRPREPASRTKFPPFLESTALQVVALLEEAERKHPLRLRYLDSALASAFRRLLLNRRTNRVRPLIFRLYYYALAGSRGGGPSFDLARGVRSDVEEMFWDLRGQSLPAAFDILLVTAASLLQYRLGPEPKGSVSAGDALKVKTLEPLEQVLRRFSQGLHENMRFLPMALQVSELEDQLRSTQQALSLAALDTADGKARQWAVQVAQSEAQKLSEVLQRNAYFEEILDLHCQRRAE